MPTKITITERALFARLKRRLAHDGLYLKKCRANSPGFRDLGRYYAVNGHNYIAGGYYNLEATAKELGLLKAHEEVV